MTGVGGMVWVEVKNDGSDALICRNRAGAMRTGARMAEHVALGKREENESMRLLANSFIMS